MYSEKLLMMDRGTARNMYSFILKKVVFRTDLEEMFKRTATDVATHRRRYTADVATNRRRYTADVATHRRRYTADNDTADTEVSAQKCQVAAASTIGATRSSSKSTGDV